MKPSDLFTDLTPQGRELMLKAMRTHDLPKGLVAVEKGQKVSGAYFVLDGELRVFTLTPAGREATLYLIRHQVELAVPDRVHEGPAVRERVGQIPTFGRAVG